MTFSANAVALAAGLLSHLGGAILSGGLFIAAVALACRLAPRMPATLRCGLWWLAALKLLIGLAWVEPLRLPLLPAALAPREVLSAGTATGAAGPVTAALDRAPSAGAGSEPWGSRTERLARPAPRSSATGSGAASLWRPALVFLWLLGAAFHLAHLGFGIWRSRGLIRRAAPVNEPGLAGLFARLADLVGLRRRPGLRASAEVETPQALGGLRPLIVLPRLRLPNLSPAEIEMTLCHELLHVRRGDLWLAWVPALAQRIFFFFPLAAWAAREYLVAREAACDAEVLRVLGSAPQAYGRLLLRWGVAPRETGLAAAGASSSLVNLKRRLQMLHEMSDSSRRSGARWWLLGALALAGVLPVTLVAQARAPKAKPAAHATSVRKATPAPGTPVVAPAAAAEPAEPADPAVDENAAEPREAPEAADAAEVTPPAAEAEAPEAEPEEAEAPDPEETPAPPPAPRSHRPPGATGAPRPEASTPPPGAPAPPPPHSRYRPGAAAPIPPAPPAALAPRAATPPPGPPPVPGAPPARAPRALAPTTPLPPEPALAPMPPMPPGRTPRATPPPVVGVAAAPPVPGVAAVPPHPGVPTAAPRAWAPGTAAPPRPGTPTVAPKVWAPGAPGRTPSALARAVPPAPPAPPPPPAPPVPPKHGRGHSSSFWYNTGGDNGWVFLSGENTSMSGSSSDLEEVKRLRGGGKEDLLWFKRDGKAYVVRDAATLQRVKEIWRPVGELGAQQGKLGAEQGKLGAQQGGLGAQQGKLGARQGALGSRQGALAARQARGGERDDASLEKESKDIDQEMEELSRQQEELGRKQEALGRQQEVLGRQQEALGRKQEEASRKAETELRQLMDEAVRSGSAQPVR